MVAAAIGGAAAAGLAGSAISSSASKKAASQQAQAAQQQAQAANQAAQVQQNIYNQTRADLGPFQKIGTAALPGLASLAVDNPLLDTATGLYGKAATTVNNALSGVDAANNAYLQDQTGVGQSQSTLNNFLSGGTATQNALAATPGYQFTLKQGLESVQNGAAARGLGSSGAAEKAAANYATGLADSTYQNQFQDVLGTAQEQLAQAQGFGNVGSGLLSGAATTGNLGAQTASIGSNDLTAAEQKYNQAYNLASLGENAAAQTGNIGQQTGANVGNSLANAGNALASVGNAQAAGTVGSANALSGGLSSLGSLPLQYSLYSNLLSGANAYGSPGANQLQSLGWLPPSVNAG